MNQHDVGLFTLKQIQLPAGGFNTFFYLNQCDLPSKFSYGNSDVVPLQLRFGNDLDKSFYTSLGPFNAQVPRNYVGASAAIIQRLGLKEKEEIFITICSAKSLSVITVRPKSRDDYNIMVSAHVMMEQIILNQVRIVGPQQPLPLQIGSVLVDLFVETTRPKDNFGRLEPYTEVIVADFDAISSEPLSLPAELEIPRFRDFFRQFFKNNSWFWQSGAYSENEFEESPENILLNAFKERKSMTEAYRVVLEKYPVENIIYTNSGFSKVNPMPCKLTKILEKTSYLPKSTEKPEENEPIHCMIASKENSSNNGLEIYLSQSLMKSRDLNIGCRLQIEPLKELPTNTRPLPPNIPQKKNQGIFLWKSLRQIKHQIMQSVDNCVKTGHAGNLLIIGPPGCGKTHLMKEISRKCFERNVYCSIVNCKVLRGKKIESLMKIFAKKWSECSFREPSVLILDDLDALNDLNEELDESGMSSTYGRRVSTMIIELAEWFAKISRIELIAVANSVSSLGSTLASVRGPRLFSGIIKIPELTMDECDEIMKHFGVNLNKTMIEKMHGFRVQDLADLASRGKLRAFLESRGEVSDTDINCAFEDTVPRALQGIQLKIELPYTWDDVGGMQDVKKTLDEIFRWPSKYPDIFASCPLRLQTGALLYGPPGCGKTLIAGALANECGMNFKSVKGPELLSKYIGASEAAVRDLFETANQARPCLLFFDELDSLAPRRGADSTGVTDRVVNQLLTELDGVEGRSGVWVLGATSRPDLIDPALLRPGRLDRVIFCNVPSAECRLQILKVLAKSLKFEDDFKLSELVAQTEGFTGADLQALLYNCQMKAIKDHPANDDLVVSSSHVAAALQESRTSLSETEKLKYNRIYERFQTAKKPGISAAIVDQVQKVTLA